MSVLRSTLLRVETWPLPREGEVVPDYPPVDLTDAVKSIEWDSQPQDGDET